MTEEKRVVHCWKDSVEDAEERTGFGNEEWAQAYLHRGTCMLERGHAGPHEFAPDEEIGVTFVDND